MFKTYLVGGSVRDQLLHLPVQDRDWVVVGATPAELISMGYQQVGKDFPVFLHPKTKEEYALARTERKSGHGYTGFICDFGQAITLKQDLARRDLTINALAIDSEGKILDFYHGLDDLKHKVLRHISPSFREDPLRVLRVARFAARLYHLGFKVAPETLDFMKGMVAENELDFLTVERIWQETEKALSSDDPQIYLQILDECGALKRLFPHLFISKNTLTQLKQVSLLTKDTRIRFAILCLNAQNQSQLQETCIWLKVPNDYRKLALLAFQFVDDIVNVVQLNAENLLALLNGIDVWRHPQRLSELVIIGQALQQNRAKDTFFSQSEFIEQVYQVAAAVNVQEIIAEGFTGKFIHNELQKRRIEAISTKI